VHLTRCLAEGLWPRVRVNAIAPGNVPTDWGRRTGRPADYDTGVEIPIEVVARAVLDLIERDDATGEVVVLEGGSAVAR
ncbi:MAG: hypothetical protein HY718_15055, partial [Planctomycetes bacterium]|nr:hypothetical protein [Planctomycetota bacterium]